MKEREFKICAAENLLVLLVKILFEEVHFDLFKASLEGTEGM